MACVISTPANALLLDDPAEWPSFGSPLPAGSERGAGVSWSSQLVVRGMWCAACALTIEDALQQVPGVVSARVNAASQRAHVVWQPALARPSQWLDAIRQAGYDAVPASDASARELRQQEQRLMLWRWAVAGFCMMQVMMYAVPAYVSGPGDMTQDIATLLRWASWVLTLPVVLFSCGPFFRGALRDLRHRQVSMDLPVALGMAIAFVVSTTATFEPQGVMGGEVYFDSLTMFVFFLLTGRWLELRLRERTAGALEALLNRLPDSVDRVVQGTGDAATFERIAARTLAAGDVIRVLPGESFPADGTVVHGDALVDEALLSGESRPVQRPCGSQVMAGSHNLSAPVQVAVSRVGDDTRFAQIVQLMQDASTHKPHLAEQADRVARPFLWAVLAAALFAAWHGWSTGPGHALMLAATVLIVTCPCALSLATPVAMLTAAGRLARDGTLARNLQALQALAEVDTVVFDKTGTLTSDGMALAALHAREGIPHDEALAIAASLASHSLHPLSRSLVAACTGPARTSRDVHEQAGAGLTGRVATDTGGWREVRLGSARHCGVDAIREVGDDVQDIHVHLADTSGWLATFALSENVRPDAKQAVDALHHMGLRVVMLSGDRQQSVQRVAAQLGIDEALGECSPDGKLAQLRAWQAQGRRVAMVGDGLNDGPVLAGAHVSFAFGPAVPLAQAHADFVVMGNVLMRMPQAVQLARRTLRVVRQNLAWAAGYNALCVPLALMGWLPAWLAGIGMAASSLLVVANAARLSRLSTPA
ncbi:heavy metal translocating P-type ATPase [Variovorax sp. VNK109]|uniref:heavy metal translocating P-type ATPase n=1 Tax=Variovorax sp. VNK109 TaxID=3400919 RepID=UPI003C11A486